MPIITLQYRFTRMVVRFDSNYSYVKGPNREVNDITITQQFWNSLAFRLRLQCEDAAQRLRFLRARTLTEDFQDNNQYEASAGINYQIFPKTRVGGEGAFGVLESTDTPLQYLSAASLQIA